MPAKTPSKGKKAAAPKAPKKSAAKPAKKPPVAEPAEPDEDEDAPLSAHEAEESGDDDDDDEDMDLDDEDEGDEEAPRAAKPAAATPAKKPAAPAAKPRPHTASSDDAPAVVPARRLTPEAKARVNEMVKKGMSLTDALKAAASWETFVAPVKDEPAKLVQGRMGGGGNDGPRHSNFAGETEPGEGGGDDEEPTGAVGGDDD
jgi:hypothetical protein